MVVYDSYPDDSADKPNPLQIALDEFTADTGIDVELLKSPATPARCCRKAALTAGNPEGDVMWGVDNTLLSRAIDADVFDPYRSPAVDVARPAVHRARARTARRPRSTTATSASTTTSAGSTRARPRPPTIARRPDRARVRRPARRREPGHVVARTRVPAGDDRRVRRRRLGAVLDATSRDNGVAVVDGWNEAYYELVHAGRRRTAPLVVSYGSSPPAEVIYADPSR